MKSIVESKNETCKLCNRKFKHSYDLFGRSCLNSEYQLLKISKPKKVKNKELYLCNQIAKKLHLIGLNKEEKYILAEKYLTIQYLDKIKYGNLDKQKEEMLEEIKKKVSLTAKSIISLSRAYRLYKTTIKFSEKLKELDKELSNENRDLIKEKKFLESMKLSAILLQNSLSLFGQTPKNIIINDDENKKRIKENEAFKQKMRNLIDKYSKGKKLFIVNENNYIDEEDFNIEFNNDYDLYLSIHGASMDLTANKDKDNNWNLDIKITDIYDFTDWKDKDETYDKMNPSTTNDERMKAFGKILNNFGVVSMKYGVLKEYQVSTEITINSKEL